MTTFTPIPPAFLWLAGDAPHTKLARMRASGELRTLLPEIDVLYGVLQSAEHHPEVDTGIHIELVLEAAAMLSTDPMVRFAALVHDLGKARTPRHQWPQHINHEKLGLRPVAAVCDRFGVPQSWRQLALLVCEHHLNVHRAFTLAPRTVVKLFDKLGFAAQPELLEPFLLAVEADKRGRLGTLHSTYPQAGYFREAFTALLDAPPAGPEVAPESRLGQQTYRRRINVVAEVAARHAQMKAKKEMC